VVVNSASKSRGLVVSGCAAGVGYLGLMRKLEWLLDAVFYGESMKRTADVVAGAFGTTMAIGGLNGTDLRLRVVPVG
jgi:hypothetical protein